MIVGNTQGSTTRLPLEPDSLGKYADCFMDHRSGLWYASVDADRSDVFRPRPRRGALPRPEQDTPSLTAQVYGIHQRAARSLMLKHLRPRAKTRTGRIAETVRDWFERLLT